MIFMPEELKSPVTQVISLEFAGSGVVPLWGDAGATLDVIQLHDMDSTWRRTAHGATLQLEDSVIVEGAAVGVPAGIWFAFVRLSKQWKSETSHISSAAKIAKHPSYQKIINLGPAVIPLILEDLKKSFSQWFVALRTLAGVDPVPPDQLGNIRAMTDVWINWGRDQHFIS